MAQVLNQGHNEPLLMSRLNLEHSKDSEYEVYVDNYIDGEFVPCDQFMDSEDPSVGKPWARIPDSGPKDVDQAVAAASAAFHSWSTTSVDKRASSLNKLANLIESYQDEFAAAESRDQGKPLWLARVIDIPRAILNLRTFAGAILSKTDDFHEQIDQGTINYVSRTAGGIAGLIVPWNLPLYLLTFKLGPALASGCTVVIKPSEMTSVTTWMMCKLLNEAGFPKGVINVVYGTGRAGEAMVRHPDVKLISFTGSTATAKKIETYCVGLNKRLSLELGGKNAAVVFEDSDLDETVPWCVRSSFINQGEVCLCTSRIFVQRSIYYNFVNKFVEAARKWTVGDPKHPDTYVGALISKGHMEKVKYYVNSAKQEGGTIHCGHGVDDYNLEGSHGTGYFVHPTVITDVKDSSKVMQEEIFGPVTCIVPFDEEQEVVKRMNNVKYGLCATVFTSNLPRAHKIAKQLEVGTVWVNCWLIRDLLMPFGGVKASGEGRESAKDSFEFYTEKKTVCMKVF